MVYFAWYPIMTKCGEKRVFQAQRLTETEALSNMVSQSQLCRMYPPAGHQTADAAHHEGSNFSQVNLVVCKPNFGPINATLTYDKTISLKGLIK